MAQCPFVCYLSKLFRLVERHVINAIIDVSLTKPSQYGGSGAMPKLTRSFVTFAYDLILNCGRTLIDWISLVPCLGNWSNNVVCTDMYGQHKQTRRSLKCNSTSVDTIVLFCNLSRMCYFVLEREECLHLAMSLGFSLISFTMNGPVFGQKLCKSWMKRQQQQRRQLIVSSRRKLLVTMYERVFEQAL